MKKVTKEEFCKFLTDYKDGCRDENKIGCLRCYDRHYFYDYGRPSSNAMGTMEREVDSCVAWCREPYTKESCEYYILDE